MSHGESSASEVWQSAVGFIRAKSEAVYKQWFKKMVPISVDEKQIVIGTSDRFFASFVTSHYGDVLADALAAAGCPGLKVKYEYGYGFDSGETELEDPVSSPLPAAGSAWRW